MDGAGRWAAHADPASTAPAEAITAEALAAAAVPDRALRPALELAVNVVAADAHRRPPQARPPQAVPAELRPFVRMRRLPDHALPVVRAALDGDDELRGRVAAAASADVVDAIGRTWLTRPDGWQQAGARLWDAAVAATEPADGAVEAARGERRRRESAERAAQRVAAELREVRAQLETERVRRAEVVDELHVARREVEAARRVLADRSSAAAEAGRREVAATERAIRAEQAATSAAARAAEAVAARDAVLADRAARAKGELHESIARLPGPRRRVRPLRTPVAIPGGLHRDSDAAAEFLLRVPGVIVLVDGYNVAKLGWPALALDAQRAQCIAAAEDIARRWATLITVVFDGAAVVGAAAAGRRRVRVVFSPPGVLADDVLRREVSATDVSRPVVVVTNDREIIGDVRAERANVMTSERFLAAAGR